MEPLYDLPDRAVLLAGPVSPSGEVRFSASGDACISFSEGDVSWKLTEAPGGLAVSVRAEDTPLRELVLRWDLCFPRGSRFLGGAWERGYGDLEWRGIVPERVMPWYFLADTGRDVLAFGVETRPHALCFWTCDAQGVSLHLDLRCGGEGVILKGRELPAAKVVFRRCGLAAFPAMKAFLRELCPAPLLPARPVYGSNNWYYAYGDTSHEDILRDADYLASLTQGLENRPYMVLDDGWQVLHGGGFNGGPWRRGNAKFPDMAGLARQISAKGAHPGIWVRLLWNRDPAIPAQWRSRRDPEYLDPTVPGVLEYLKEDIRTLRGWGYTLIKHDFSTFDLFGRWGFQMGHTVTDPGWRFANESITSAEAVMALYEAVLESAGGALILGCNCMGHLGAGLMHLNRTGDDTSGRQWERTRKMGVNTLAFTLPMHRSFFAIDADCVGVAGSIPWERNREWLRLLAGSGTPLFASIRPGLLTPEQEQEVRAAFAAASTAREEAVPLDWQDTTCPESWLISHRKETFRWMPEEGNVSLDT